jgi:hypothetical protein
MIILKNEKLKLSNIQREILRAGQSVSDLHSYNKAAKKEKVLLFNKNY